MNNIKKVFLVISLVLFAAGARAENAGTTAMGFLQMDVGARYIGMGGVGVGSGADIMGAFYNPAAIGKLDTFHLGGATGKMDLDFKSNFVGASVALPWFSFTQEYPLILGVYGLFSDNGDEVHYNMSTGEGNTRSFGKDTALAITLSEQFAESQFDMLRGATLNHYLGASAKYLKSSLPDPYSMDTVDADGFAVDLGYQAYSPEYNFGMGVSLLNLGPAVTYIEEEEKLPLMLKAGLAFDIVQVEAFRLNVGGDYIRYVEEKENRVHIGAEAYIFDILAARAGYRFLEEDDNYMTLGFGLKLFGFQVDYGFMLDPIFGGDVNQISLSYTFPKKDTAEQPARQTTREMPQQQVIKEGPKNANPIIY